LAAVEGGLTGKLFGPYRVLSLLGHGGMGSVWLAERVDGLFKEKLHLARIFQILRERVATRSNRRLAERGLEELALSPGITRPPARTLRNDAGSGGRV